MLCDRNGRPDPNGDFELINGKVCLRDGRKVRFDVMLMDGARPQVDAKAAAPATIDEALRQRFAEMAKQQNTTVEALLATMEQTKIEETAAEVAKAFISAQAGQGVASTFATDSATLTDAERSYAVARARQLHDMRCAHLPEGQRPAFTSAAAASAVADAVTGKVRNAVTQHVLAADQSKDASSLGGLELARREARKCLARDAWRA